MKQRNAVKRLLEGEASFNVRTFTQNIKGGQYSDGAMTKTQAAWAAFLSTFKEEAAEE